MDRISRIVALSCISAPLAVVACNDVAPVDVHYGIDAHGDAATNEGGAQIENEGGTPTPHFDASAPTIDATATQDAAPVNAGPCDVDGGGCDITQGLGCCIPGGADTPFCTDLTSAQTMCKTGVFVGCSAPDVDSMCCWSAPGATTGGTSSFASTCGARKSACSSSADCGGLACETVTCKGITFGACGSAPECPP